MSLPQSEKFERRSLLSRIGLFAGGLVAGQALSGKSAEAQTRTSLSSLQTELNQLTDSVSDLDGRVSGVQTQVAAISVPKMWAGGSSVLQHSGGNEVTYPLSQTEYDLSGGSFAVSPAGVVTAFDGGLYRFNWYSHQQSNGYSYASLYVNGSRRVRTESPGGNTFKVIHIDATVVLVPGDFVTIQLSNPFGGVASMEYVHGLSRMEITCTPI